jgi:sugar/nucleoside kinase (ribokinase family)
MGVAIAGFKLGEAGLYLKAADLPRLERLRRIALDAGAWANTEKYHQAFAVDVVGTTGAGDSALAGFMLAVLRGLPPAEAVTMACAVGACNVEALDAVSGIRSWDETRRRVSQGWRLRPEKIT